MPQLNLFLDDDENKIVNYFSEKWTISKHEAIKRMVRDFKDTTDKRR